MAPGPTPTDAVSRSSSSSSSSLPKLIDGPLEVDDTTERRDHSWNRMRVLVKHGAAVVKDLLPVAHTITEKSYEAAKLGTKFGFDCADTCLDITTQGMQKIGADGVADMLTTVADKVQEIGKVTDASLSTSQQLACGSITSATSTLELFGVEDGRTRDLLAQAGLIDAETVGALFTVFRIASKFANDAQPVPLMEAPQLYKAVLALSQVQKMAGKEAPVGNVVRFFEEELESTTRLRQQICRYARFALAAFRSETLRLMGVDVPGADAGQSVEEAIAHFTGIRAQDVRKVEHGQKACQPAYFVAIDHDEKQIVVSFRGTLTMHDVLTDLVCESVALECTSWETGAPQVHKGMWEAASTLSTLLSPFVEQLLGECGNYGILLCGYSLGAGVATLLTRIWREKYPTSTSVRCFAFAPPCSMSLDVAPTMSPYVTSVIVGDDIVPRLSLSSAANLRDAILALKDNRSLMHQIPKRAQHAATDSNDDARKVWAQSVLDYAMAQASVAPRTRFVPAGRILWLSQSPHDGPADVLDTVPHEFGEIVLTSSMLLTHMPASYAKALRI